MRIARSCIRGTGRACVRAVGRRGERRLRAAGARDIQALPRPPQSLGDGRLLSCGAKIFMDGSGAGRTAWMYTEWRKNRTEIDHGN